MKLRLDVEVYLKDELSFGPEGSLLQNNASDFPNRTREVLHVIYL